jgi:hypothetical protein
MATGLSPNHNAKLHFGEHFRARGCKMRLLIVDGHEVVRRGIRSLLSNQAEGRGIPLERLTDIQSGVSGGGVPILKTGRLN